MKKKFDCYHRPDGGSNPGSLVYETNALPLGHRANLGEAGKIVGISKPGKQTFNFELKLMIL